MEIWIGIGIVTGTEMAEELVERYKIYRKIDWEWGWDIQICRPRKECMGTALM